MDHGPSNMTLHGIYYALRNQSNTQADVFVVFFFFLQNHNKDNHTRKKDYYKNRAIDDSHRVN